ncbi:MAG: hypothetical protein ABUT39_05875 [Acidobacteriota bacterium]
MRRPGTILTALLLFSLPLSAQHQHSHPEPPPAEAKPEEHGGHAGMEGMDMADHDAGHDAGHEMPGLLGPYRMSREASGTAWQPESAPHEGLHAVRGDWHLMAHGFLDLVYDDQDGPRGDQKLFSESMLMGVAVRQFGADRLGFRAMVSAEPWTVGDEGYPLLLQTGETADGRTPLVDRQHPHDLFMELAATYSHDLGPDGSAFVYLGLPGEPALGPPAFLHRFSGMENPEAPLGHHWLDSTHITFGVATLGWIRGGFKLEGSAFKGREPDEDRTDIEDPKLDSWAVRASWQPTPDWSFQVSRGHLNSPEQLEPEVDKDRTTASAIYNRPFADGNWQTTFAWGRNESDPGETTDSFLLESAATLAARHTVFGRVERQENDELAGHGHGDEEVFDVGKISLGYVYDAVVEDAWKAGVGSLVSLALIPSELEDEYGEMPVSWMVFLRTRM